MKTQEKSGLEGFDEHPRALAVRKLPGAHSSLYLLTPGEVQELRQTMAKRMLPPELGSKLASLAEGDLVHRLIEQNCRLFIALIEAAQMGAFRNANQSDMNQLLSVLAYVQKEDDAIPDYLPDGFIDDFREVRMAATELGPLLGRFNAWRLRNQVRAFSLGRFGGSSYKNFGANAFRGA